VVGVSAYRRVGGAIWDGFLPRSGNTALSRTKPGLSSIARSGQRCASGERAKGAKKPGQGNP
jgi:hypothetical protein